MSTHRLRNRWIELRFRTLQRLDHVDRAKLFALVAAATLAGALLAYAV